MPLPQPKTSLAGSCSVIFNNVLYSYSADGFQSLTLGDGGEWEKLSGGQAVEGGVCVGTTPSDPSNAALFIVGGTSSSSNYTGLQKYTFGTGEWETITPDSLVTKDRTYHSATYINGSDTILVYSGSTDGSPTLSSETFTIGASSPYSVLSFASAISPPGVAPFLLPWSDTQAVMLGGNPTNTEVMLFDMKANWTNSGTTLAEPLPKNTTTVKASIIQADDGSKHLYTFDLATVPNVVNRTVLLNGNGDTITDSAPIQKELSRRSDLTASQWPEYNSTYAPQFARSDYSLASDSSGLVVMSGGNAQDVLCIFNARQNSWENATKVFGEEDAAFSAFATSSASSTASATSTDSGSSSSNSSGSASNGNSDSTVPPTTILGVVLGIIFGVALILIALLLLIKRQRNKRAFTEAAHSRRASGIPDEKSYFEEEVTQSSGGYYRRHQPQDSTASYSSMAILMGKVQKPAIQRKASNDTKRSLSFKTTIGRPQPQSDVNPDFFPLDEKPEIVSSAGQLKPQNAPARGPDGTMRRSSGWNRYWSSGSNTALNILGLGNGGNNAQRETAVSDQSSHYQSSYYQSSHYSDMNRRTQDSATVPPLHPGRPGLNKVSSGSPTVSQYNPRIGEGMSAEIERPVSAVSALSSSGYSSGIPPSVHDNWDPTMVKKPWGSSDRAPSSLYSQQPADGHGSAAFPTALGAPGQSRPPMGMSQQPQLAMASTSSDMSWLNLGEHSDPPSSNSRY
ncbi:hypothetical protein GGR56DRAFT_179773 [Xylariaceae sp. FL0804]|nr:hypothetical protein GGR56DRAFT_179773 [Xylariaceae sp. FL0804]